MPEEISCSAGEDGGSSALEPVPAEQPPQKLLLAPLLEHVDTHARSCSETSPPFPLESTQLDSGSGWGIDSPARRRSLSGKVQEKPHAAVAKPEAERQPEGGTLPPKSAAMAASTWLRSWWQLSQEEDEDPGTERSNLHHGTHSSRPGIEQMRSQLLKCVRLLKELQAENASLCRELEHSRQHAVASSSEVESLRKENWTLRTKLKEVDAADNQCNAGSATIDSSKGELYQMQVALVAIVEDLEARLHERDLALEKKESRLAETQAQLNECLALLANTSAGPEHSAEIVKARRVKRPKSDGSRSASSTSRSTSRSPSKGKNVKRQLQETEAEFGDKGLTISLVSHIEVPSELVDARENDDAKGKGKRVGKGLTNATMPLEVVEIGPVGTVPRDAKGGRGFLQRESPNSTSTCASKSKDLAKLSIE